MEKTNQLEKNKNPDWKQWIPIYGVYQIIKDALNDKPSLYGGGTNITKQLVGTVYHGVVTFFPILKGLETLIK